LLAWPLFGGKQPVKSGTDFHSLGLQKLLQFDGHRSLLLRMFVCRDLPANGMIVRRLAGGRRSWPMSEFQTDLWESRCAHYMGYDPLAVA